MKVGVLVCICLVLPLVAGAQVFRIDPAGTGDYSSLKEAIAHVPTGATITLAPGTYIQTEPLLITKSVRLIGEDMETTVIVGTQGECVLKASVTGTLYLEGIGFRYEGEGPADVVVVRAQEMEIISCSFTGAIGNSSRMSWAGLMIVGETEGVVRHCLANNNRGEGITVGEAAAVTVEACTCSDNSGCGIAYIGSAEGLIRENFCENNGQAGIAVGEQASPQVSSNLCSGNNYGIWVIQLATPTLVDNTCEANKAGILYGSGSPSGSARGNWCQNNEIGILAGGNAFPTLEKNTCSGNTSTGIGFSQESTGVGRENRCTGNLYGIVLLGSTIPVLEGNICSENERSGILFGGQSAGKARANRCETNGVNGIEVKQNACPLLTENICSKNNGSGLAYYDQSSGSGIHNICEANAEYGIEVNGEATPTLKDNTCVGNSESGIGYHENAAGIAESNLCRNNGVEIGNTLFERLGADIAASFGEGHGIFVGGQAGPVLKGNTCVENNYAGIGVSGSACPQVEGSVLGENALFGVFATQTASLTLFDCTISGNEAAGIHVSRTARLLVANCRVTANQGDGILATDSAHVEIWDSTIADNLLTGLLLEDSAVVTGHHSTVCRNMQGVEAFDSSSISLAGCIVEHNRYTAVDLSGSAKAEITVTALAYNFLGLRSRERSRAILDGATLANNSSGTAIEDETHVKLKEVVVGGNTRYAILMLGNSLLTMNDVSLIDNGINDVLLGNHPYGFQRGEAITAEVQAQDAGIEIPDELPEAVQLAVDAIVEVWPSGYDEITGEYWEFAANGVVLSSGSIVTVAHVFYGEDVSNPDVWLKLSSLEIVDADEQIPVLRLEDLKLGATAHGPHPAAMDHERDIAALYPKDPTPVTARGLLPAESVAYGEPLWVIGYVGFLGTGEIWRYIPSVLSIPPRDVRETWVELQIKGLIPRSIPKIWLIRVDSNTPVPGMSGSPVVNERGEVAGVVTFGPDDPQLFGPVVGAASVLELPELEKER